MKLKCIGGECDGEIINCEHVEIGYSYRAAGKQNFQSILDLHPFDIEGQQKTAAIMYYVYNVACFNLSQNDLYYFLKPEGWTDKQAIIHQFNK